MFFIHPSTTYTVFIIHTNNALTLYKKVKDYQTVMANNYINTDDPKTPFIRLHYVNIININSDIIYQDFKESYKKYENVEVNDWGEKDPKWKLIYLLTFMVRLKTSFERITEFKEIDEFKDNPRVYLTDHIFNISSNSGNEEKVAEYLGINYSIDNTDLHKVYSYCSTKNMCELVYLCMDFWNIVVGIDDYNIIVIMIEFIEPPTTNTDTSGSNTTGGDSNTTDDGSSNGGDSNTTGGDSKATSGTGGSNTSQGTGGKEMSNVILRF